jgi:hypothetical protein
VASASRRWYFLASHRANAPSHTGTPISQLASFPSANQEVGVPRSRSRRVHRHLNLFENVYWETRGELGSGSSGSTGELLPCGSSCASANSNRAAPIRSGRNSSCDTRLPTSDSHTAAVRTSSCIASLRLHVRSGSSTSVFCRPKLRWGTDWPGRHRRPSPKTTAMRRA